MGPKVGADGHLNEAIDPILGSRRDSFPSRRFCFEIFSPPVGRRSSSSRTRYHIDRNQPTKRVIYRSRCGVEASDGAEAVSQRRGILIFLILLSIDDRLLVPAIPSPPNVPNSPMRCTGVEKFLKHFLKPPS